MRKFSKLTRKLGQKLALIPGSLFIPLMMLYYELVLHFWITDPVKFGRVTAISGFALGFGCVLGLACSFLPAKAGKWTAVGLSLLTGTIFLTEYFLSDAYKNFMTVATILAGAGGVAQDYFSLVMSMLLRNLWRIVLMLLPTVAYAIWGDPRSVKWKYRSMLACVCAVSYILGYCVIQDMTTDTQLFTTAYNFDSAVRHLGLNMGLALDVVHSAAPPEAPEFTTLEEPVQEAEPEATEETTPVEVEYGYNVMDLDFAAIAKASGQKPVASIHNYVNSLTPAKQNAFTGMFKGKNLIFITAEAFSAEVIDPELTPTLYRMATEGIQFKEYYQPAWGASTTTGEFSNLVGLVPMNGGTSMNETYQHDLFLTIGKQLQKLGYHSTAYHNHVKDFYQRNNTHTHLGYDRFIARYGGLEGLSDCWPESDLEMMDITVPQFIDQQPFSIYYMTVSGHCEYSIEGNAMTEKNWDKVQHLNHSDIVKGYIAANLELEYAMESLLRQLEEAGIADDTLIVLATDHYPYGLERSSTWKNTVDHLAELYGVSDYDQFLRDHNALIMWSGCLEDMDIVVDTPVYSLDILPTISNLFGVEYDSRLLVGRDVFSDAEPLVLWPDYNWITDKGTFEDGTFTPRPGVEVDQTYVKRINSIVKNKITYSKSVVDLDYFDYLQKYLNATGD